MISANQVSQIRSAVEQIEKLTEEITKLDYAQSMLGLTGVGSQTRDILHEKENTRANVSHELNKLLFTLTQPEA